METKNKSTKEADIKIAAARYIAIEAVPYFSSALYALIPKPVPGFGTVGVTMDAIMIYDPTFVENLDVDVLAWVLVHEVSHILREHFLELKDCGIAVTKTNCRRWNIAADLCINQDIAQIPKLPMHPKALMPEMYKLPKGLSTLQYYKLLEEKVDEGQVEEGEGNLPGTGGTCGSASGNPLDGEDTNATPAEGDVQGRSEAYMDAVRSQVANEILEEVKRLEAGKGRGVVPAGLRVWADIQLQPAKVNWRSKLRFSVRNAVNRRAGLADYTYTKRSRRQGCFQGHSRQPILPGTYETVPTIAVGIDTSGSMGTAQGESALAELAGVLKAVGVPVTITSCDSEATAPVQIKSFAEVKSHLRGGGGTSFIPIFDVISKARHKPNVLIVLTDGDGDAPQQPQPGLKVFWVLVGPCKTIPRASGTDSPVDYGTVIEVD